MKKENIYHLNLSYRLIQKKNKGCISDDLLDREIYSISISYNHEFNIYVCNKKADEEFIKKAISIGLIEDIYNDDSNEEDDF